MAKTEEDIDLLVIGDALIDMLVPSHDISKNGVSQKEITITPGGSANIAVWATRHGIKTAFAGIVGDDHFGELYHSNLLKEKIIPILSKSTQKTGICICLIDKDKNKERTMIVDRGASNHFKKEHVPSDLLKNCKYVYFSGHVLESDNLYNELLEIMKCTKEHDAQIIFNGGSHNIIKNNLAKMLLYSWKQPTKS